MLLRWYFGSMSTQTEFSSEQYFIWGYYGSQSRVRLYLFFGVEYFT